MQNPTHTDLPAPTSTIPGPDAPTAAVARPRQVVGKPLAEPGPATLALYAADWARFVRWCRAHGQVALPATPETVATFLLAVAPGLSRGSLGRLRAAIAAAHRRAGLPVPSLESTTHRALRESGKRKREAPSAPRPSAGTLVRIAGRCPRDTAGLRDRALMLLTAALPGGRRREADGHAGTARHSLLLLDAEHVRFTSAGVTLDLRTHASEAGPTRSVALARGNDAATCSVRAVEDWLRASDTTFGPVFRKVDRWGNVEHGRLHPDAWHRILVRRAGKAGVRPRA